MIRIDGAIGEGGGQVLRTSLALSMITGQPFQITNIRRNRPKPGLRPQHLEAVKGSARICHAEVTGAAENSTELRFKPGPVESGRHRFEIHTAGSAALLLQTVALPLAFAGAESHVEIRGGTHVPWSPCADYLEWQWAYWLGGRDSRRCRGCCAQDSIPRAAENCRRRSDRQLHGGRSAAQSAET